MYKRKRTATGNVNRPFKRPRTSYNNTPFRAPRRTYAGSMVPLRSGGYTPNRVERKVNDLTGATYQVNSTGVITLLANPVLGSDFNQRIGRKIFLKSFYVKGNLMHNVARTATNGQQVGDHCRMIIFCDFQPNGAVPAITDLLVAADPTSQLNLNNRDRFRILADKEYVLDPYLVDRTTAGSMYASTTNQVKFVKKFKKIGIETIYNATNGGTIADINSGALYMLWIGMATAGAGTASSFYGTSRVRYADA